MITVVLIIGVIAGLGVVLEGFLLIGWSLFEYIRYIVTGRP